MHSFEPEDFKCTIWDRAFISFKTDVKITERGKERQTQQVSMRGNWQRDTAEVKVHSELAAQLLTGTGWWHEYFLFLNLAHSEHFNEFTDYFCNCFGNLHSSVVECLLSDQ